MRGTNVARVDEVEANESEWVRAHRALSRLARERAAADAEEGRWLLAAIRSAAHVHLGFGTFNEYIERLFGYSPRSTQEKLRVAEALEGLPAIARALASGVLNWSAARELTRVAVEETENDWLAAAASKTVRQLEDLVAGAALGDLPSSPRDPALRRHVLRFEVAPETFAAFREALRQLRKSSDTRLDDDALLLTMARAVLGGPSDDGKSSYQVSLSVCRECVRASQLANGELVAVGPEVVALAECDGQQVGAVNDIADEIDAKAHESAHMGASVECPRARAKQTIPPALRRAVLQRDQHRCRVPGCNNATFVDLHHIVPRAEGGRNEGANLLTICGAHHRAAHRGELIITGDTVVGARFAHADGTRYGGCANPQTLEVHAVVFKALRQLGFREAEVRAVLGEVLKNDAGTATTPERVLREALARLTRPRS